MLFSRSKNLVGLDIGTSSVKAVELKELGKGRGYQLVNIGMEPLSPEAIVDGAIMDSGLVIDAIQKVFTNNRIKGSDVAISLSGHAVIIKKISLPVMNPDELAESIQWEGRPLAEARGKEPHDRTYHAAAAGNEAHPHSRLSHSDTQRPKAAGDRFRPNP